MRKVRHHSEVVAQVLPPRQALKQRYALIDLLHSMHWSEKVADSSSLSLLNFSLSSLLTPENKLLGGGGGAAKVT